jgi:DNA-binding Xre family transcriptional regulator
MTEPIFRTTGKFIELEYPGVTRKFILKNNISFIQCSQYSICISVSGVEGSVETIRFTTTDKLDIFLRAILVELSKESEPKDESKEPKRDDEMVTKARKDLASFLHIMNKKFEKLEGTVNTEVKTVKDLCTHLEGQVERLDTLRDEYLKHSLDKIKEEDTTVFIDVIMFLAVISMTMFAAIGVYHGVRLFRGV